MTSLEQAAKAVMDRWDSNEYNNAYLGVHITTLRKALADEQAQAVESITDCMMNLVDRLGHEASSVDARAWSHLLVYAPKQAVEPTLSEILAEKGIKLRTQFEEKPRDHVENNLNMVGERAELIAALRECHSKRLVISPSMFSKAADMLEADAREIEATERQVEILSDELSKCDKAQQVAVPMSADDIYQLAQRGAVNDGLTAIVREVEAHHKIKPQGDKL